MEEEETIVAAALQIDGLTISAPPPARHHTLLHPVMKDWFKEDIDRLVQPDEQGFLTNKGRFVRRREAAGIALYAGQIEALKYGDVLYSEDLW